MRKFGIEHIPNEWRLFTDASSSSLKGVLLHNGNRFPSIPIVHSVYLKENYKTVKQILEKIYYKFEWQFCGDFKIISLTLGQQLGYTSYPCFLCLWNSRDDNNHYTDYEWPLRKELAKGDKNVENEPLINPQKVLLPPLHIKLGLMKQFFKALPKDGKTFAYIRSKFLKLSEAKVKAGVFVGPQIRKLMQDEEFETCINRNEKRAWRSIKEVIENFLGNSKSTNYREIVANMCKNFKTLGCRMSVKVHFLFNHIDYFPENLGDLSEEHGERFHQDIKEFEKRYAGKWSTNFLADYCWSLVRETDNRQNKGLHFPLYD